MVGGPACQDSSNLVASSRIFGDGRPSPPFSISATHHTTDSMSTTSSAFRGTADPISGPRRRVIEAIAAKINQRGTPLTAADIASAKKQLHPWSEQQIKVRLASIT